jgi:ribonucleoside-diphosphate reductase alpha chain
VLGSIALHRFITNGSLDEDRFRSMVHLGTRFLDNLVDGTRAPLAHVRRTTARTRKVGLGIMGFADALIALGIPYDDRRAVRFADRVASLLADAAREASETLARERGAYPEFQRSRDAERGAPPLRNATRTTIAPTGTIALIAGCSSGIEPVFGFVHARSAFSGEEVLHEVHPALAPALRAAGETPERWIPIISGAGTVRGLGRILPKALRRVFVGALEVAPEQHLAVQAAFQRHVESGVSKTVNLPSESTVEDVEAIYRRAFELRCKGVTVYRYGSKEGQVLCLPDDAAPGAARECGG